MNELINNNLLNGVDNLHATADCFRNLKTKNQITIPLNLLSRTPLEVNWFKLMKEHTPKSPL